MDSIKLKIKKSLINTCLDLLSNTNIEYKSEDEEYYMYIIIKGNRCDLDNVLKLLMNKGIFPTKIDYLN